MSQTLRRRADPKRKKGLVLHFVYDDEKGEKYMFPLA